MNDRMIETLRGDLSNLIRDSSLAQKQAAMRTLLAAELASDWYTKYPDSVGASAVRAAVENGSIRTWVRDRYDSIVYGCATCGLSYSGLSSGKLVSAAELDRRCKLVDGWLREAIAAMQGAGAVDRGVDDLDKAFAECGGSVSWL